MSNPELVKRFFTGTGPSYDFIVNLCTYGADRYWKSRMLSFLSEPMRVLDLACGTGILTFMIAAKFPSCRIVGIDMMQEYITIAQARKRGAHKHDIEFVCGRAEEVLLRETFDCVTSSYIPKYVPAQKLMDNISPYIRPGGKLVLHDFTLPRRSIFQKLWTIHMGLLKYVGSPIFPHWKTIFYELGDLVRDTKWLADYTETVGRLGYLDITVKRYTAGSAAVLVATKPN